MRLDYSEIFTAITEERMKNVFFKARESFAADPPEYHPLFLGKHMKTHDFWMFLVTSP